MTLLARRGFLSSLFVAPAIVTIPGLLMPVKPVDLSTGLLTTASITYAWYTVLYKDGVLMPTHLVIPDSMVEHYRRKGVIPV